MNHLILPGYGLNCITVVLRFYDYNCSPCEFFTLVLADGLWLESEWQQSFSSLLDSSQNIVWYQQCSRLPISTFPYFFPSIWVPFQELEPVPSLLVSFQVRKLQLVSPSLSFSQFFFLVLLQSLCNFRSFCLLG